MTKERRAAIRQWEYIVGQLKHGTPFTPTMKELATPYTWRHTCWFCQYVRKDYRCYLKSRENIPVVINGCEKCPLYKYEKNRLEKEGKAVPENKCGCDGYNGYYSLFGQVTRLNSMKAAEKILAMLKGEKLWLN